MPQRRQGRRASPSSERRVTRRTPIDSEDGGTRIETTHTRGSRVRRRVETRTPLAEGGSEITVESSDTGDEPEPSGRNYRQYARNVGKYAQTPTAAGTKTAGSVDVLTAEYFGCILLIIVTEFAGSSSYGTQILAIMKRCTLATILFFILALMSASGPNAARLAKALGALVIAGMLFTSQGQSVLTFLDGLFKADWASTTTTTAAIVNPYQFTPSQAATVEGDVQAVLGPGAATPVQASSSTTPTTTPGG